MPAKLPPSSAYTFAAEYSIDEAMAAGAKEVRFNKPVFFYQENFIGFPVGDPVPNGYFDRANARWVAAENGRVIAVVSVENGLASIDIDGDKVAEGAQALSEFGLTEADLTPEQHCEKLASVRRLASGSPLPQRGSKATPSPFNALTLVVNNALTLVECGVRQEAQRRRMYEVNH